MDIGKHGKRREGVREMARRARAGLSRRFWQDSVRFPAQTVVAVLCAYYFMVGMQWPDVSWAAFSALFVVRANLEGTAGEATARIAGALAGIAIGVALAMAGLPRWPFPWAVVAGVGIMGLIAVRWPLLNYGLVTVAVLTVAPDPDLLDGAWDKALAIMVGSLSGILGAALVLPRATEPHVRAQLAHSLRVLGKTVAARAGTFVDCNAQTRRGRQGSEEPAAQSARDILGQARWSPVKLFNRKETDRLLGRIDALWCAVPVLDSATRSPLSPAACKWLGDEARLLPEAFETDMRRAADMIETRRSPAEGPASTEVFKDLERRLGEVSPDNGLAPLDHSALQVAHWGWGALLEETQALWEILRQDGGKAGAPDLKTPSA